MPFPAVALLFLGAAFDWSGLLDGAERLLAGGDASRAVSACTEVLEKCRDAGELRCQAGAFNLRGGALLQLGRYEDASRDYREALDLFRRLGAQARVVDVLNNLASVRFYRGDYPGAWRAYREARMEIDRAGPQPWSLSALQVTEVNQAALLQKLGRHGEALRLFQAIRSRSGGLTPAERARMLGNFGALLRRLGDPVKAVRLYHEALGLPSDLDTRLGIRKNLGMALSLEFADYAAARREFEAVEREAARADNQREQLQARLYRAETERRAGNREVALPLARAALSSARSLQLPDEEWKALLLQARLQSTTAPLEQAAALIERMKPRPASPAPGLHFFEDRAEVFDERIQRLAGEPLSAAQRAAQLLFWQERLRARTMEEAAGLPPPDTALAGKLQQALDEETVLVSVRVRGAHGALAWLTRFEAGALWFPAPPADALSACLDPLREGPGAAPAARCASLRSAWWDGLPFWSHPKLKRLVLVSDGPLALLPVELFPPGPSGAALAGRWEVFHLPAARMLLRAAPPPAFVLPWTRALAAFAPSTPSGDALMPGDERLAPLVESTRECRDISALWPGRTAVFEARDASSPAFLRELGTTPVIHVAAHAVAEAGASSENRILFSDGYLFPRQLPDAPLRSLRLVALSACDSGAGEYIDGEGVRNWAHAFLSRGAGAVVASLWRVDDRAARQFMGQFHGALAAGLSPSAALARAKGRMQRSSQWGDAYYWAGFVLVGDGRAPIVRSMPWTALGLACSAALALAGWRLSRRRDHAKPHRSR